MTDEIWRDSLPEELRPLADAPIFKDAKTLESGIEQLVEQTRFLGDSIRVPSSDAGEEAWSAFNEKLVNKVPTLMQRPKADSLEDAGETLRLLGMPETPDGYSVASVEHAPEGAELDELRSMAHKYKWTAAQFRAYIEDATARNLSSKQDAADALANGYSALKEEWGNAYQGNIDVAVSGMFKTGVAADVIEAVRAGTADPDMVKHYHGIGVQLGANDSGQGGRQEPDKSGNADVWSPARIQERLDEIMPQLFSKDTPPARRDALQAERLELNERLYRE